MNPSPREPGEPQVAPTTLNWPAANAFAPLLCAGVMMFAFLTFPPAVAELNADASLKDLLHHAAEHKLQFGNQIVSTYGPLGFLVFPQYSAHALGLRMATDVLVCFTVAAGLCLVAWRLRWPWRILLIAVFLWSTSNLWLRMDLVLHCGLFFWGLLCLIEQGRRLEVAIGVYSALAAFCGLAKVSLLFIGAAGLTVLILHLALSGRGRLALAGLAGFCAAFFGGWIASGQHAGNVFLFLDRALLVARSYNAALGVEGLRSVRPAGFAAAGLALVAVILRCRAAGLIGLKQLLAYRALLLAWILLFAFTSWKHGFVRGDNWHVGSFFGFVPLVMLALEALPLEQRRSGIWCRALSVSAGVLPLLALQIFTFPPLPGSLGEPFALFRSNLERLFHPGEYDRVAGEFLENNQRACELPRLRNAAGLGEVDVFGQHQAYALCNGLKYQPRPVPQSYSACNARLMRLNEEFFFSDAAPEYWLFQLSPMDRKFAPLEDAWLLRSILLNCQFVDAENGFLLLRKNLAERPRLKLLEEGELSPGQALDLRQWNSDSLWLELELRPNVAGTLRQLLYRPPTVRLAAWREPGKGLLHRGQAPAAMLAAGFLASPLLVRTDDVQRLYSGNETTCPGAYSVELGEHRGYWRESVRFRVYRIQNPLLNRFEGP